jgi:hypothetical protein
MLGPKNLMLGRIAVINRLRYRRDMKITLSKVQWEGIGKKAGWMKMAQYSEQDIQSVVSKCLQSKNPLVISELTKGWPPIQIQEVQRRIQEQRQKQSQPVQAYRVTNIIEAKKKEACSTCPTHNKTDSGKKDEGKKGKAVNPWAVCNSTSPKKENPEKFERCVQDVKKEHPIKKD